MKKIAILLSGASLGGIETALINMLNVIDLDKYQISIFTNYKNNPCIGKFPTKIKTFYLENYSFKNVFLTNLKKFRLLKALLMGLYYLRSIFTKSNSQKTELISRSFLLSDQLFDCAIAYKQDYLSMCMALFQIKSLKKIMWLHGPIWHESNPDKQYLLWLDLFNKIFGVSFDVVDRLNKVYPKVKSKSEVFFNIMDKDEILFKSKESKKDAIIEMDSGSAIKILSVGRFCEAKNFENIPYICKKILELGIEVKWFIIGYGELENVIKDNIIHTGMNDRVVILGKKENPFPYISNCDVYIQPSKIEGRSISVVEAQILAKPVIITRYPTSNAQLIDGFDGMIVPIENDSCAKEIAEILSNPEVLRMLSENAMKSDYCNRNEIYKLYSVIED